MRTVSKDIQVSGRGGRPAHLHTISTIMSTNHTIHTLDLNFQGIPGTIAAYLIPHDEDGAVLIECGPGSTVETLESQLDRYGFTPRDITDVLVTHIHLDHAGAAGWLARHGATIYVHHVGAPHLIDPRKLLASAERIYGDDMDRLWGEMIPVPDHQIIELEHGAALDINGLEFDVLETPGHAYHHAAYLFEDVCFTGDVGGVRMLDTRHIALPLPPPEINLDLWRDSLNKLRREDFARIAPTHFGIYNDIEWHLDAVERGLDEADEWIEKVMPEDPPLEELQERVTEWMHGRAMRDGMTERKWKLHETANPSWMAAAGLRRYWKRHRQNN